MLEFARATLPVARKLTRECSQPEEIIETQQISMFRIPGSAIHVDDRNENMMGSVIAST